MHEISAPSNQIGRIRHWWPAWSRCFIYGDAWQPRQRI